MGNERWSSMIASLKSDVKPATGCTEPIALAYASAIGARDVQGEPIERIEGKVSPNIMKNAMGVIVPGTGVAGLPIACAVGALGGDPEGGLQVLSALTEEDVRRGKAFLEEGRVSVSVVEVPNVLYAEANIYTANHHSRVCIADSHTNVVRHELDGNVLFEAPQKANDDEAKKTEFLQSLTLREVYDFAMEVPLEDIQFIYDAAMLNSELSTVGLSGDYGLALGASMEKGMKKGLLSADIMNTIIMKTTAASDARMGGAPLPAMTNSGSGNQGIAATMPVVELAKALGTSKDDLTRALALSHMTAIYIHGFLPKLSALCAVSTAGMGAAAGMAWIMEGDYETIERTLSTMTGDIIGMICDGAASSCASKVATTTSSATRALMLAIQHKRVPGTDGIVSNTVDESIRNIGRLASVGMKDTDPNILSIMLEKNK